MTFSKFGTASVLQKCILFASCLILCLPVSNAFINSQSSVALFRRHDSRFFSSAPATIGKPSDLPDSLDDAAEIAARASASLAEAAAGGMPRCRVDFDTSVGDETFPILKTSSEFMQKFVSALCYAVIPGLQSKRQNEMMKVVTARAELQMMQQEEEEDEDEEIEPLTPEQEKDNAVRKSELRQIIANGGRDSNEKEWDGPKARIYFPDAGNAALATRDWKSQELVPPCVEFSYCGGVQQDDLTDDMLIFFFCPKASDAVSAEEILYKTEENASNLKLSVFVNPNLVDMGVTGFGMAGRLLRERLIDGLINTYYLRTLPWGALTRIYPQSFSVWQEDGDAEGGYRLIKALDQLPSNPEVEDIYDIANGNMNEKKSGGFLDQFGDFVNGMMRL